MITSCTDIVILIFFCVVIYRDEGDGKLIAINESSHSSYLYFKIKSRGPAVPLESDPAFANAADRKSICKEITRSGFFELYNMRPVRMKNVFKQLAGEPRYTDIFSRIYSRQNASTSLLPSISTHPSYEYTNYYAPVTLLLDNPITGQPTHVTEYVFVCLLKHDYTNNLFAKYVSKEYNVFGGDPYMPGRFIFDWLRQEEVDYTRFLYESVGLAEEPADIEENPNISKVELHYLHTRKHLQSVRSDDRDPLCRLLTRKNIRTNERYRLCVAISRSSYFRNRVRYPKMIDNSYLIDGCNLMEVSFRTPEAVQMAVAAEQSYYERMAECHFVDSDRARIRKVPIYISRGYRKNQIFVYRPSAIDGKVYLENLSTHVSVVDIEMLFEDVED